MEAGPLLALGFVGLVIALLTRKFNAIAVLLFCGLAMLVTARGLGLPLPPLKLHTGFVGFDFLAYVIESLADISANVGLVIMIISGFVAYMDKIGASDALVRLALKPLGVFKKSPYILATLVMPLGQMLFVSIPSAAGLGLLLMATVFPILIGLGVSRISAVALITATTAFGIGPASAIALSAAKVLGMDITQFFFAHQVPMVLLLSGVLSVCYFWINRRMDARLGPEHHADWVAPVAHPKQAAPLWYGILPVLPLVFLLIFSDMFALFPRQIKVDTNLAMLAGLLIAMAAELVRTGSLAGVMQSLDVFWGGMGDIFKSVVTLIVAADIFSKGLIALGFINSLVSVSQNLGFGGIGIGIIMTVMIFLASILMGSGNAAFFAFGPLIPAIATQVGMASVDIILPMSLAASMGRTVSPIAGVVVAASQLAKVPPVEVVKRSLIPFLIALVVMLIVNFS